MQEYDGVEVALHAYLTPVVGGNESLHLRGSNLRRPLYRRLCRPQRLSRRYVRENNILPLLRIEEWFQVRVPHSIDPLPTELSWLIANLYCFLLPVWFTLISLLSYFSTLKKEATCTTETLVYFQGALWSYIPEDRTAVLVSNLLM
jgi:hypothetical protein